MYKKMSGSSWSAFASVCLDAVRRAFRGALFAMWVPPAVTFVFITFPSLYQELAHGKLPITDALLRSFAGGLAIAGMAFLMGALLLALFGVPVLFCLRILRVNHPLVAGVAAACLTYWRFVVSPTNGQAFSQDFTLFVIVAAITGYAAAKYASRNATFVKEAPKAARFQI